MRVRSSHDTIPEEVFDLLKNQICMVRKQIAPYRNKFLAHAADIDSRSNRGFKDLKLTWNLLEESLQTLTKLARVISELILASPQSYSLNITLTAGALQNLERPYLPKEQYPRLHRWWEQERSQVRKLSTLDLSTWVRSLRNDATN
jgi:hypothetical protein